MSDDPGFVFKLGVHLQELAAGLLGSLSGSIVQHLKPIQYVGAMIVGGLTALYCADAAARYLGTDLLTAAYIIGVVASPLCLGIIFLVKHRLPQPDEKGSPDVDE